MSNIAVVGCGAVTELMYVDAIRRLKQQDPGINITALVDRNIESANKIAAALGQETGCLTDYEKLFDKRADSVIITLPNFLHAKVASEFLKHGINVFLEKPMGTSIAECDDLIKASADSGAVLAINHFRRRYPSLQVIRNLIQNNVFGRMTGFNVYEGRKYDWPLSSHWLFDSSINKGGTLIHNGCHTIDILIWMLGEMEILDYRDDLIKGKGIESDCDITVRAKDGAPGKIRMSFVTRLKNRHFYEFEKGWIAWNSDDVTGFEFGYWDIPSVQKVNLEPSAGMNYMSLFKKPIRNFSLMDSFTELIDNFLKSTRKEAGLYVDGHDAKRSIEFIDKCYSSRKPIIKSWKAPTGQVPADTYNKETIAVLGASGFIGSNLVQRMAELGFNNVRPAVRNYSKGAAICQTGYPLHVADVKDKQSLIKLFTGCSTVYHCAVGDEETMVSGISNCIDAAVAANVKQLIYISTARVFGYDYTNINDASSPKPPQWNSYALSKTSAEKIIEDARAKYSIDIRMVRPCVVWGPNSALWTLNIMNKIISGKMFLLDEPQSVSNLIYIDNLIDILLLVKDNTKARNANFNVADFNPSWKEFIGAFCGMLDVPLGNIPTVSWEEANESLKKSYAAMAKKAFNEVIKVQEVKDLILSLPYSKRYVAKRRERLDRKMQGTGGEVKPERPKPEIEKSFLHLQNCRTVLKCENLRTLLKYEPRVDYQSAICRTREWLAFNGFIK